MYLELDGALVLVWVCVELLGNGLDCVLEAWVVLLLWVFEAVLDSVGLNELKTSLLRMLQIWILPRAWRSIGTCLLTGRLDPSRGTHFKGCTLKEKIKNLSFLKCLPVCRRSFSGCDFLSFGSRLLSCRLNYKLQNS